MAPGLGSGQTAVLASTPDGLRGPVVDDGIKVNGQVSVGFVFVSGMPAPAIGQPIDSTGLEQPIAPIDVTAAAATGTLAVDLIDTGGIGGNAPLYLVTRDQATNQVLESRLLFPARATFASTTPLGTPLVVASATVPTTTPVADGTLYYHQDGLGTVTELTDSNGNIAKAYVYDAYGNILESPGTVEQPYTYTGREFDGESGLYYYRSRTYDSASGRFAQKDPLGIANGDPNLYSYVRANPLYYTDPTGQCPWCVAAVVGAVSGAGFDLAYQLIVNGGSLKCVDWESVGSAALTGAAFSTLGPTGALLGRGGANVTQYGYSQSAGLLNRSYVRFGWSGPKGEMDVLSLRVGKKHFDLDDLGGLRSGADPARDGGLAGLIGASVNSGDGGPCGCIR